MISADVFETPVTENVEQTFQTLLGRLRLLVKQEQEQALLGIGLALTGPTDPNRGTVLLPGKIRGLEGFSMVPRLREEFGTKVWAENDGLAAMYAEKHAGLAREKNWAVVLTIGTGIGSGVMLDRKILKDPYFMFGGQAGHLVLDFANDQLCLTGARGTGEMLCSATALSLAVCSGLQRGIPSTLTDCYWKNPHSIDFRAVIESGVAKGDPLCLDELQRWTIRVGWLLVNVVHAYSPEVIILAGGATAAHKYFLDRVRDHVARNIFRYPQGEAVPICISELGDNMGVVGAAMMVKERLESSE
jgi:glucokinase